MKLLSAALLLFASFSAFAQDDSNVSMSGAWRYDMYFDGTRELGPRIAHDAWTWAAGRAFVISCIRDRETGKGSFRFFIHTNDPIHKFGEEVEVRLNVGDDLFRLKGTVSNVYVGNVHVVLPNEPSELLARMRKGRRFDISIDTVAGVYPVRQEFSLMGFNSATLNTITNCIY